MLDIVERATTMLPALPRSPLAPVAALANHSCLPNCQVESSNAAAAAAAAEKDTGNNGGDGGSPGCDCASRWWRFATSPR